jgi:hypothetical protein
MTWTHAHLIVCSTTILHNWFCPLKVTNELAGLNWVELGLRQTPKGRQTTYNPRDLSLLVGDVPASLFPPPDPIPPVFSSRLAECVCPPGVPQTRGFSREHGPYDRTKQDQGQWIVQRWLEALNRYTPDTGHEKEQTTPDDDDIQLEWSQPLCHASETQKHVDEGSAVKRGWGATEKGRIRNCL